MFPLLEKINDEHWRFFKIASGAWWVATHLDDPSELKFWSRSHEAVELDLRFGNHEITASLQQWIWEKYRKATREDSDESIKTN